jgi:hypothetical protein
MSKNSVHSRLVALEGWMKSLKKNKDKVKVKTKGKK